MGHIHRSTKRLSLQSLVFLTLATFLFVVPSVSAQKVLFSPNLSPSLPENSVVQVQFRLSQPIICPQTPPVPCEVQLDIANPNPAHITLNATTVTWLSNEWAQTRTITLTTIGDGVFTPTLHYTLPVTVDAATSAPYYLDAGFNVALSIVNTDPALAPGLVDQTVQVSNGAATTVDVLVNATNNPDPSTLVITAPPLHGTAVDPPATITYTPNPGYVGADTLAFRVCSLDDGSMCTIEHLNFQVRAAPAATSTFTPTLTDTGINLVVTTSIAFTFIGAAVLVSVKVRIASPKLHSKK